jgi:hypothetical protein
VLFFCTVWSGFSERPCRRSSSFPGHIVEPIIRRPLAVVAVLAMLAVLIFIGLAAQGLSLVQSLVSLAFGAGMLLIGWQWQQLQREKETGEQQPSASAYARRPSWSCGWW